MLKSILVLGVLLPSLAAAAPFAPPKALPLLSGTYYYVQHTFCQIVRTDTYAADAGAGGNVVADITMNPDHNTENVGTGTLAFAQGDTAGTGTATVQGFEDDGSSVLLKTVGVSTESGGQTMKVELQKGSAPFTQTATTLALPDDGSGTYDIYYGKTSKGVVQYAVYLGLDSRDCAEQYVLTHK